MLMYKSTLRFLACFCLALTASPTFLEAPFSGIATIVLWPLGGYARFGGIAQG